MKIDSKVFLKKRFIDNLMLEYGFIFEGGSYKYESNFLDGEFKASIEVKDNCLYKARAIDNMNDEEYVLLNIEEANGAYVNTVRSAYEELLQDIADKCCEEILFPSEQANRITKLIYNKYSVSPDFPWDDDPYSAAGVFRHLDSKKWFGLIMTIKWDSLLKNKDKDLVDVINLKINPKDLDSLVKTKGIYPAFHMNHKSWISVTLNEEIADDKVMELIDKSFDLT